MKSVLRSLLTACFIAAAVQCLTIGVLSPNLPRIVGRANIDEKRELTLPKANVIYLNNEDGWIQVHTYASDGVDAIRVQARIRAYVAAASALPTARSYVKSLIRLDSDADKLQIITEPEERPDAVDLYVDYLLQIPRGTDITLEGSNGNIWISKGCGRVSVAGRNTDIEIVEPSGSVVARSTNGRIRVVDAPLGATLKTVNGNVYAHMLGGTLSATTTNGSIVAHVLDPKVNACDLKSQNGGITLVMQDDCSASIEAVTGRGVIASDLSFKTDPGFSKKRHLRGSIREGHTKLRMDTLNGNIWITKGAL